MFIIKSFTCSDAQLRAQYKRCASALVNIAKDKHQKTGRSKKELLEIAKQQQALSLQSTAR